MVTDLGDIFEAGYIRDEARLEAKVYFEGKARENLEMKEVWNLTNLWSFAFSTILDYFRQINPKYHFFDQLCS